VSYETTREVEVTCDRCGTTAASDDRLPYPEGFDAGGWVIQSIEIRGKWGSSYPESGWGPLFECDLCAKCFAEWLVPLLREHGVNVRESEWDH
jgi:hypothetical protein